jgi:hypothetical protein
MVGEALEVKIAISYQIVYLFCGSLARLMHWLLESTPNWSGNVSWEMVDRRYRPAGVVGLAKEAAGCRSKKRSKSGM